MTITLQKLPDENIFVTSKVQSFDPAGMEQAFKEIFAMLETLEGKLYIIVDMREMKVSFSELVMGLKIGTKINPVVKDGRVVQIFLGSDDLIKFIVEAFKQEQYGTIDIPLFSSMEDALAYARGQLKAA